MYDTNFRPERPGWLKQLISRVRIWLRQHGIMVHHLSDDDIQSILARAAQAERKKRGTPERESGEVRYAQQYYQVPFAGGLKRVVDPAQKANRDPVYVRDTPEVFRKIGFTALPMMANARHLRLNYYTADEFKNIYGTMRQGEHAHGLHDTMIHLPQALEHPLAIVVNQTPNAKPGSVVAITDMNVNGKKVVVPVLIEATSSADGARIDSHLVLTVYDENDWIGNFLKPALDAEKKGIGIFYFDKEKAARYSALSNRKGSIPTGFVHNIDDEGSPVKGIFKKQTETLQFQRWFKNSEVVDQDGEPLVVYHATNWNAMAEPAGKAVLDFSRLGQVTDYNASDPKIAATAHIGVWFNDQPGIVKKNTVSKYELAGYLRIENPFDAESVEELADRIAESDSPEAFVEYLQSQGYDGVRVRDEEFGGTSYIIFDEHQFKSTDNVTFDPDNSDFRYSIAQGNEDPVVLHNLSAAKLRRAAKLGGLPVPSLAIVDAEKSDFSNFGEISLVADKNLIDPKLKGNKVFNADAYSPRAPWPKSNLWQFGRPGTIRGVFIHT